MERYVIPIIEMVMETITQNLTRSSEKWNREALPGPGWLDGIVMDDDGFVCGANK
jgi:hypothetical protein